MKQWDIVYYVDEIKIKKVKIRVFGKTKSIVIPFIISENDLRSNLCFDTKNKDLFTDLNKAKKQALDNLDKQISVYLSEMEEKRKEILFKFI